MCRVSKPYTLQGWSLPEWSTGHLSISFSAFSDLFVCLSSYLCHCLSVYLSLCPSVLLSVFLPLSLSVYLSVYLFVRLSFCLSVYLYLCPSVCLSFIRRLSVCRVQTLHIILYSGARCTASTCLRRGSRRRDCSTPRWAWTTATGSSSREALRTRSRCSRIS